ncbi:hypothetical protein ACFL06_01365 [Patescibacteria group bacterium]
MSKRIIIATLSGLLFGLVCYGFASSGDYELPWSIAVQIIISRTLIGFAIGISCLKMRYWAVNGVVTGILFSLPLAFSGLAGDVPGYSKESLFFSTVGLGAAYGFLIEVITSVIFKAKQA